VRGVKANLIGKTFGDLTVTNKQGVDKHRNVLWQSECKCGGTSISTTGSLCSGRVNRCRQCAFFLRPYEALYKRFLRVVRTGKAQHKVNLSFRQFLGYTKIKSCHYCWAHIPWSKYSGEGNKGAYFLDRKDNTKGYSFKNCVVCCVRCNRGKGYSFTYREWRLMTAVFRKGRR
jgi:hypothetical protein